MDDGDDGTAARPGGIGGAGSALPPPPSEERSLWVTVGVIGCLVLVLALVLVIALAGTMLR